MSELVRRIKTTTAMLGEYAKTVQRCEESLIPVVRRSIVAGANLFQGHLLEMKDLTWLRPAGGLAPGEESRLLGKTLKRDLTFGERLSEADVE
jgi:sialic acid synthase SpsE